MGNKLDEPTAFTQDKVSEINCAIACLDSRLFLFADFEPKFLDNITTHRFLFLMNVINAYSLMYDCGKIMQMYVLAIYNDPSRPKILDSIAQTHLKNYKHLFHLVSSIRNSSCHNMSSKYYNNDSQIFVYYEFLARLTGMQKELHEYSEQDWNQANTEFVLQCEDVQKELIDYIKAINCIANPIEKAKVVQYWLDCLEKWYVQDNKFMLENILCSCFAPKVYPQRISGFEAKKRLGRLWRDYKHLGAMSLIDSANDFYNTCEKRVPKLLNSQDCPSPALPIDFYKEIIQDLRLLI